VIELFPWTRMVYTTVDVRSAVLVQIKFGIYCASTPKYYMPLTNMIPHLVRLYWHRGNQSCSSLKIVTREATGVKFSVFDMT